MSHLFPLGLESPGQRFVRSTEADRSAVRLMAIIAEHHHRGFARYAPRDVTGDGRPESWCNVFAQDVAEAMGVPLPRNTRANELAQWLATLGSQSGWVKVSERVAQIAADTGALALASTVNPSGPGHLAVLVPSLGEPGIWVAQAGRINFTRRSVKAGFGELEPTYFAHK